MLQIRKAVAEVNAVLLQEGMDLRASVIPKQPPQLSHRKLAFAVCLESNRLQRSVFEIMPGSGQEAR